MRNIIYILILVSFFFSCNSQPSVIQKYRKSLEHWENQKVKHNNSYRYTLYRETGRAMGSRATITVKKGKVIQRHFEHYSMKYTKEGIERIVEDQWTENKADLGIHKSIFAPQTIDELYQDCKGIYINSPKSEIKTFNVDTNHIIRTCGYTPEGCHDDCFRGIELFSFEWL